MSSEDMRKISCEKCYHHEEVVMEVVDRSYLVFPRASEGPLCILGTPRCKTLWLRLVSHTLRGLSQEWGNSVKRINSRHCCGVREWKCLSLVKHPEQHKKEICLRKGIVLVMGGLDWYLEYCQHLECQDGGHPLKRIMLGIGMCITNKLEPMR